jgi:hypothetical protein
MLMIYSCRYPHSYMFFAHMSVQLSSFKLEAGRLRLKIANQTDERYFIL